MYYIMMQYTLWYILGSFGHYAKDKLSTMEFNEMKKICAGRPAPSLTLTNVGAGPTGQGLTSRTVIYSHFNDQTSHTITNPHFLILKEMANMASGMPAMMFAACFAMLLMVVAAHDGHHHTPGMYMAPAPSPTNSSNLVSPSMVIGFIAFIVSLLVVRERV